MALRKVNRSSHGIGSIRASSSSDQKQRSRRLDHREKYSGSDAVVARRLILSRCKSLLDARLIIVVNVGTMAAGDI